MKLSACGRFVVLDGLYVDREVYAELGGWAEARGVRLEDAVQLAIIALLDPAPVAARGHGTAGRGQDPAASRCEAPRSA